MTVKVIKDHDGEGVFPLFKAGANVTLGEACTHYVGWHACAIDGHKTYIPKNYVIDGKLTKDYNPTELIQKTGDILQVKEIVHAWLICSNDKMETGWMPAEKAVSV